MGREGREETSPVRSNQMMRKRSRKYLITGIILVALPLLYLMEERVRGEWLLARYKRQLIARGEKLTIEELTPPVPKGTNVLILDAFEAQSLLDVGQRLKGEFPGFAMLLEPGKAVVSWQRDQWFDETMVKFGHPRVPGTESRIYTWDDYLRAAEPARERLPELRHQITNQVFHISLDYGEGGDLLLPHIVAFKDTCLALCQAASHDLHNGNLDGALENLHAAARLAAQLESDRLLLGQLVRIAMGTIATRTMWEALQAEGWTDAQLALMQSDWRGALFTPRMIHALRMERAIDSGCLPGERNWNGRVLEWIGLTRERDDGAQGGAQDSGLTALIESGPDRIRAGLWCYVWACRDQLYLMEGMQQLIDVAHHAWDGRELHLLSNPGEAMEDKLGLQFTYWWLHESATRQMLYPGSSILMAGSDYTLEKSSKADAWNGILLTAIALKRFQLKHGHWPDDLAALAPEFLPSIPVDWMDGQPLRYRLRDDGTYLLYSVGSDGIDQGGSPEPVDEHNKDWMSAKDFVWPQPATREEVAAADAEAAATAAATTPSPPELDEEMMKRYGLLPPEPDNAAPFPE